MKIPAHSLLRACALSALLGPASLCAQEPAAATRPDLLRLSNGDVLQGSFEGMTEDGKLEWKHPDVDGRLQVELSTIHRIGLNGGQAFATLPNYSYAELENGDRFAGSVVRLDGESLEIDTPFAGILRLPQRNLARLSPNPHGGLVHYLGPYSDEDWTIHHDAPQAGKDDAAEEVDAEPAPWVLAGGAWYSNGDRALSLDGKLPDRTRIRFKLAWKSRLNAVVGIHATMAPPEPDEAAGDDEDGEAAEGKPAPPARPAGNMRRGNNQGFADVFGPSYVLTLYSNYAILYRVTFDEEGNGTVDRLSSTNNHVRLNEIGEAEFELRCDREDASITLYINGTYVGQWGDPKGYAGTGRHLAFSTPSPESRLRLSDVAVTSWNGMLDSALSMESAERDVLLLTNGTDRFSGKVAGIRDGMVHLQGTFAEMHIPLADIEEIRFARDEVEALPSGSGETLRAVLQPVGRMTLLPRSATRDVLSGTLITGDPVDIDLKHVDVLEFGDGDSALDDWDEDF